MQGISKVFIISFIISVIYINILCESWLSKRATLYSAHPHSIPKHLLEQNYMRQNLRNDELKYIFTKPRFINSLHVHCKIMYNSIIS